MKCNVYYITTAHYELRTQTGAVMLILELKQPLMLHKIQAQGSQYETVH